MEVSQQIRLTLPSTITYSSSEVPNMWLCVNHLCFLPAFHSNSPSLSPLF